MIGRDGKNLFPTARNKVEELLRQVRVHSQCKRVLQEAGSRGGENLILKQQQLYGTGFSTAHGPTASASAAAAAAAAAASGAHADDDYHDAASSATSATYNNDGQHLHSSSAPLLLRKAALAPMDEHDVDDGLWSVFQHYSAYGGDKDITHMSLTQFKKVMIHPSTDL